jgi:hypothetical protein
MKGVNTASCYCLVFLVQILSLASTCTRDSSTGVKDQSEALDRLNESLGSMAHTNEETVGAGLISGDGQQVHPTTSQDAQMLCIFSALIKQFSTGLVYAPAAAGGLMDCEGDRVCTITVHSPQDQIQVGDSSSQDGSMSGTTRKSQLIPHEVLTTTTTTPASPFIITYLFFSAY